tara:strand:+ start:6330 stop:7223 length:894 start_codon:yes stop_codon:yes gene_type:complete
MNQPPLKLAARESDSHKGSFGRVTLVGGSRGMSGSISLSSIAALHTGSGLVSAAVPDRCLETVAAFHPALMTIPLPDDDQGRFSLDATAQLAPRLRSADAIGCGPGMTVGNGSLRIVERLLVTTQTPRVLDADAINCLPLLDWPNSLALGNQASACPHANLVLTPHPGELARLTGVSPNEREQQINAAAKLCDETGVVIVVKGGPTVVVRAAQQDAKSRWTNSTGNPGMASGGSGDVLTGVITSLLGQGLSAWDAARLGVWVHGRAGDLAAERYGAIGMTAKEILGELPMAMQDALA